MIHNKFILSITWISSNVCSFSGKLSAKIAKWLRDWYKNSKYSQEMFHLKESFQKDKSKESHESITVQTLKISFQNQIRVKNRHCFYPKKSGISF